MTKNRNTNVWKNAARAVYKIEARMSWFSVCAYPQSLRLIYMTDQKS